MRLDFLDGLRGLMALWVALGHGFQDYMHVAGVALNDPNYLNKPFFQQAFYAHFAVDTFIVLSGFCLMLPVLRSGTTNLKGGIREFFTRRARRILPPYYAALALAIGLSALRWEIGHPSGEATAILQVDLTRQAILSHLFLVQNLQDLWARGIDGPLWSVATEWQIYFLFPLLLFLRRHLRSVPFVVLTLAFGVAVLVKTPYGQSSCSWYLGLFAMGMVAAQKTSPRLPKRENLGFVPLLAEGGARGGSDLALVPPASGGSGQTHIPPELGVRGPLILLPIALFSVVCVLMQTGFWQGTTMWVFDAIWGLMIACLLWLCAFRGGLNAQGARKFLEWPPLVALGTFSYSFYLIHAPLLNVLVTLLLPRRWPPLIDAGLFVLALPIIIGLSYLFHLRFERPFMSLTRASDPCASIP